MANHGPTLKLTRHMVTNGNVMILIHTENDLMKKPIESTSKGVPKGTKRYYWQKRQILLKRKYKTRVTER
uniref:Uncharacterized protein n=1 Tax=Megaselia scalaris TaxID=36166 RepID=T1GFG5_MEGSC